MIGVSLRSPSTLSGTIFDDANGLTDNVISGTATNTNSTLYANLVSSSNTVADVVTIPASGTYAFSGLWEGTYSVVLSTTAGTVGSAPPAPSLPSNWVNTGEGVGATSTGDGTPNGIVSVTVSGTGTTNDVPNINFGVDQRPSSASATVTLASQANPGGTATVPIATTAFAGSDPEDGTYPAGLSGRQVALAPATNGILYYNGTAVTSTTVITGFNPALVTLDPIDGAITASFAYTIYDNALVSAPSATTVNLPFSLLTISGTIFDDANGLTDNVISGTATNAGGPLYVIISNAVSNTVVTSTLVPATGVYSLTGLYPASYSVRLSTTSVAVGATAPAVSLPTNFTAIGEGIATAGDGTPNGITSVTLTTASVAGVNFGIDQRPSSASATVTLASQANPGGTTTVPVATTAFAGSDPEDGTYPAGLAGRQVALAPATNGILYYNGTAVTSTTVITGFNPALVTLDPIDGAITASFAYTIYDNALVSAPSATTVNLPFNLLTISGTIFDDANGLTDNVISGTATNAGGPLYVIVSEATSGTVVTSALVPATGVYSLTGLYPASYSVRLSTTSLAVGATAPAVSLPANFTAIGEGIATAGDGTPNGITSVTLTTASVAGVNFGIDQRPSSASATVTLASQANPGGTTTVPIATTAFAGSDSEDGTYPAGLTGRQVALAPATNGILYYNGTAVTSTTIITGFNPALVTLDPIDGAITASFAYTIYDNALVSAPSATTVNLPFNLLTISGTVFDDANGLTDNVISGTATNGGGPLYVIVSNAVSNTVVTSTLVPATGVYSLTGLYPASYSVRLSTTSLAVGATAPAVSLPANFTAIGEGIATAGDGTSNGITSVTLTTASVAGVNFSIDQRPSSASATVTLASQANPGGTATVPIATTAFAGSDPEDGTYPAGLSGRQVALAPATNGILYYNGTAVTSTTIITGFNPALVTLDPIDGAITASFAYTIYDNALVSAPSATTVNLPFNLLTISGTIFDDANGLTDNVISGTATNAGGPLYVIVSEAISGTVVTSTLVPATGVYSLTGLYPASYSVRLSTTSLAVGATAPAVSLPANFTAIGEGIATAGDGTPNGITSVTLTTASVAGVNFGLDQLPIPTSVTLTAQANPGGTNSIIVPSTIPTGTDADGIVSRILYTAFPANATSISIGGTVYTAATFPPAGVTVVVGTTLLVDPVDGVVTVSVPFRVIDNALQLSLATGTITIPFTCPPPLCPIVNGQRISRI